MPLGGGSLHGGFERPPWVLRSLVGFGLVLGFYCGGYCG